MIRYVLLALVLCVAGCGSELPPSADGRKDVPMKLVNVRPFRMGQPDAVLLFTGGTGGMLEVCNCSGPMPGGLARRSGLVESYRYSFPDTILVDVGDAFWVVPTDNRNKYILRGYAQIRYDAVTLGDSEWAAGPKLLAEMLAVNKTPAISTTVTAPDVDAMQVFKREFPNAKVAVVTDTAPEAFHFVPKSVTSSLRFAGPDELSKRVADLKAQGYIVVLIAHADENSIEDIASRTAADLIIRGHTTRTERKLTNVAGKPVVKVGGYEHVAAVAIKADGNKIASVEYRPEVVDTSWPIDGQLLLTYQAYAHAAMMAALDAERKTGLEYQTSQSCGTCHKKQLENWIKTRHANAYVTLVKVKRTGDPNCLMCHTTGFGTKAGFYTIEKTKHLANVNCQDCHRFNDLEHRKGFIFEPVAKEICQTCHTPITDPKFDMKDKLAKVRCPSSGHKADSPLEPEAAAAAN